MTKLRTILFSILALFWSYVIADYVCTNTEFQDIAWEVCLNAPVEYKSQAFCQKVYDTKFTINQQILWDYILWKYFDLEMRNDFIYTK